MLSDQRRQTRHRCRLNAEMRIGERTYRGRVFDLSRSGICIGVSPYANLAEGDEVDIFCKELGALQGRVKWRTAERVGIAFMNTTDTNAKVESYFRYFAGETV